MCPGGSDRYPEAARQVVAADVGKRVTVRRKLPGGLGDVIGDGTFDGEYAELRRADGGTVRIERADIVASRVVRPR